MLVACEVYNVASGAQRQRGGEAGVRVADLAEHPGELGREAQRKGVALHLGLVVRVADARLGHDQPVHEHGQVDRRPFPVLPCNDL